ncbi:hypothetical protein BH23BAC2_BH23BAC2_05810 [soil metagenome]
MKYIPLFFALLSNLCYAQNNKNVYSFDHLLEYEYREEKNSKPKTIFYLTNSKINGFYIRAEKRKEIGDSMYVKFIDFTGRTYSSFDVIEEDFILEDFLLNCSIVYKLRNFNTWRSTQYQVVQEKDTVIDDREHQAFVLKIEKEKREKRRKLCRYHTILEKNTSYHLAPLLFPIAYEEYKANKSIPNGIPRIIYDSNHFQNDHHFYELKKISRINKLIQITGDCN